MIGPFDFVMLRSAAVKDFERVIDQALRHAAKHESGTMKISTTGFSSDVVKAIVALYTQGGWSVCVDPATLEFALP